MFTFTSFFFPFFLQYCAHTHTQRTLTVKKNGGKSEDWMMKIKDEEIQLQMYTIYTRNTEIGLPDYDRYNYR